MRVEPKQGVIIFSVQGFKFVVKYRQLFLLFCTNLANYFDLFSKMICLRIQSYNKYNKYQIFKNFFAYLHR